MFVAHTYLCDGVKRRHVAIAIFLAAVAVPAVSRDNVPVYFMIYKRANGMSYELVGC